VKLLHVFDMDGTLLLGSTATLEISRALGLEARAAELESRLSDGTIGPHEFARSLSSLWHGLTPERVHHAFLASPWIQGIQDVMTAIRDRGDHSLLVTMSPNFFADHLLGFGLETVVSTQFPPLPLDHPPSDCNVMTPCGKLRVVDSRLQELGLERSCCLAYGDSASDLPLFEALDFTIALNSAPCLRRHTRLSYEGTDLRTPFRTLLACRTEQASLPQSPLHSVKN
jgi:phosphoserine phosphatase